jgi:hypothetical protein
VEGIQCLKYPLSSQEFGNDGKKQWYHKLYIILYNLYI